MEMFIFSKIWIWKVQSEMDAVITSMETPHHYVWVLDSRVLDH